MRKTSTSAALVAFITVGFFIGCGFELGCMFVQSLLGAR